MALSILTESAARMSGVERVSIWALTDSQRARPPARSMRDSRLAKLHCAGLSASDLREIAWACPGSAISVRVTDSKTRLSCPRELSLYRLLADVSPHHVAL